MASEGSDAYDELISISKSVENEELESLMKDLMAGHRYLKGNFRTRCSVEDCKGVADHCIKYACQIQQRDFTKVIVTIQQS